MAKQHKDKLTHISPVWYQLKLQDGAPYLAGGHDADADWMADLREPVTDVSPQHHKSHSLSPLTCPYLEQCLWVSAAHVHAMILT